MSQETIDVAQRFFAALDQHDETALLELVRRDVEFTSLIQEVEGRFRGHEGFRAYLRELFATFPDLRVDVEEMRDIGDNAVVRVHVAASGVGSGVPIDLTDWQAVTVRDGRAASWAFFRTETEALEAVGPRG
jgi:ketosteroid isomerase-like protein